MRKYRLSTWEDLEQTVNTELSLTGTQGSGNVKGNGDGLGRDKEQSTHVQLLVDCKYTKNITGSISIKKADYTKTEKAARRYGRIPIMAGGDASGEAYIVIGLDDFKYLYSLAKTGMKEGSNE